VTSRLSIRMVRSALATALMLWFAGAGCAFVASAHGVMSATDGEVAGVPACHSQKATSDVAHEKPTAADHSPLPVDDDTIVVVSDHSCCKSQPPSAEAGVSQTGKGTANLAIGILPPKLGGLPPPSGAMSCCPLMSAATAVVAKPRVNDATAAAVESAKLPALLNHTSTAPLSAPLRLPNRGHTYLRCCAFLI
jgi:hypothetical protein